MKIRYGCKNKSSVPTSYQFVLSMSGIDDVYFSTFEDTSDFKIDIPVVLNPEIFIMLGIAILTNKHYIEDEVKKYLWD